MKRITLYFKQPDVISEALFNENYDRKKRGESELSEAEKNDWYERASRIVKGGEDLLIHVYENGRYEVEL